MFNTFSNICEEYYTLWESSNRIFESWIFFIDRKFWSFINNTRSNNTIYQYNNSSIHYIRNCIIFHKNFHVSNFLSSFQTVFCKCWFTNNFPTSQILNFISKNVRIRIARTILYIRRRIFDWNFLQILIPGYFM